MWSTGPVVLWGTSFFERNLSVRNGVPYKSKTYENGIAMVTLQPQSPLIGHLS